MSNYEHITQIEASFERLIDPYLRNLNVAIPANVESYDAATKTCACSVVIWDYFEKANGSEEPDEWPKLEEVPIVYPGGGAFTMTWPLKKGDPVLLIFSQRDLSEWWPGDGSEIHAPDGHDINDLHNESSAICLPRLFPQKKQGNAARDRDVTLEFGDSKIILKENGETVIEGGTIRLGAESASRPLALGDTTENHINTLKTKLDAMGAILSLPPTVLIGDLKSTKVKTNA